MATAKLEKTMKLTSGRTTAITTTKYLGQKARPNRRAILRGAGAAAAATLATPFIARAASAGTIKVGYSTPATGRLSLFGETDGFSVKRIEKLLENGLETASGTYALKFWCATASRIRSR